MCSLVVKRLRSKKKKKEWWRHKEKEERTAERPAEIHPAPRQCKVIPAGSVPMDLSSSLNLLKKKKNKSDEVILRAQKPT